MSAPPRALPFDLRVFLASWGGEELTRSLHSGHVSAITVSPQHRRLGLASMMMDLLEKVSERDEACL